MTYLATFGRALKCFRNASACEPTDATAFLSSSSDTPKAFAQYCRSQGSLRFTLLVSGGPFLERSSPIKPPATFTPMKDRYLESLKVLEPLPLRLADRIPSLCWRLRLDMSE